MYEVRLTLLPRVTGEVRAEAYKIALHEAYKTALHEAYKAS